MDYVRIGAGARIRHAIIDRHNAIAPGAVIGHDHDRDRAAGYHVTEGGLVVVPLGDVRYYSRETSRYGNGYSE
jgi:glucose-1-phosphate adenylyltransferase